MFVLARDGFERFSFAREMRCVHCGNMSRASECRLCFRLKNGIEDDVFYDICARICEAYPTKKKRKYLNPRVVGHPLCTEDCIAKKNSYTEFVRQATRLRVREEFKIPYLTQREFNRFVSKPCIFCGTPKAGGIDRDNSKMGYTIHNSQACCSQCNYLKKNIPTDVFVDRIRDIDEYQAEYAGR